ncbi:SAGA-associated factor 29 like [Spatholobus suberectus]|nr:SAGA-associated factor 29 like [Spatholobus suberectus]
MSSPDIVSILENSKELDRVRERTGGDSVGDQQAPQKLQARFRGVEHDSLKLLEVCPGQRLGWDLGCPSRIHAPEVVEKPGTTHWQGLKCCTLKQKIFQKVKLGLFNLISNLLINQIDALLPTGPQGQTRRRIEGNEQKRKRVKTESDISRLTSTMRNQLEVCASLKGEQVAARVTPRNADKDEWFVVKVIHFDKESKEFEVLDEEPGDDEESSGQRQYKLPMGNIIPFPRVMILLVPKISLLENMFWQSIQEPLHFIKQQLFKAIADYLLEFDDDEEDGSLPQRTVPFHKVVPLPEGHRQ